MRHLRIGPVIPKWDGVFYNVAESARKSRLEIGAIAGLIWQVDDGSQAPKGRVARELSVDAVIQLVSKAVQVDVYDGCFGPKSISTEIFCPFVDS